MTWGQQNTRSRSACAARPRGGAGHQLHRHRGNVSGPAERDDAGTHRGAHRHLASRASAGTGWSIATKIAGPGRRDWIRDGRTDVTRETIAEAVETSLARLQTDYIDLYQIHWPQRNVPMFGATEFDPAKEKAGPSIAEQVEGMAAMIKAGKIRYYGLSNETAWGVSAFCHAARSWAYPGR